MTRLVSAVLVVLFVLPIGCGGPRLTPPPAAPAAEGYIVGAPDDLRIHILPEPEIVRDVRVRPDGMISIDLIGDVQAAGRSPQQIADEIQTAIRRFKRDASVSVSLVQSPSQFITIYGEVATPSTIPLMRATRISEAIGQVGGAAPFAALNKVRVVRTTGSRTEVLTVRLKDIQRGDLSTNLVMREGDLVVVPPTMLARAGYVLQQLLFPFQPLFAPASIGLGVYNVTR
jgi:polysaccharide export outer membrane protein